MSKDIPAIKRIFALCLNIIVLAVSLVVGNGKFSSLDDFFMTTVLTGAYGGKYDVHMFFVNVVYGYFLRPFYALLPNVSWYSVFQTFTVFASFTALCFVTIERFGKKLGVAIAILLLTSVSPDFYLHVAFTQCAGIAIAAGIFLFLIGCAEKKRSRLVIGIVFLLVGFVFRKEMFLLGMPTLATLLFFVLLRAKAIWKPSLIALAVLALAFVTLDKFNSWHYKGDYEYYAAYQSPRAYFGDGAFFNENDAIAELDERGLNSLDLTYLRAWYFYDKNVFSLDSMKKLIEIVDRHHYEPNYAKFPLAIILTWSNTLLRGSVWSWAFLCLSLIFFSNKRNWWVPWVSIGLISVPYAYLLLVNRVIEHVEVGIWALGVIFVLFFVDKNDFLNQKQAKFFLQIVGVVCILCIVISGINITFSNMSKAAKASRPTFGLRTDWLEFLSYVQNHPNDVFLLPYERYKELSVNVNHFFTAVEPGSWNNIYSTGYWNIHLPAMEQELKKRGVDNLFKDITKDNVYVMSEATNLSFTPYYNYHYHTKLKTDTLKSFGPLKLLKYRVKENDNEKTQR